MIKIHEGVRRPEPAAEGFAGNHLPGMFQEHQENLERLFLELDFDALLAQLTSCGVRFEAAEAGDLRVG